ncbi:hypothetical protein NLU14_05700 [Marinobacter sp. 71-i]|uniref:DUF2946 domain-containing protein n=1 Tax=Marinobacter iranensis TaxID=2962607 RepID=A0ABT5Y7R8_9GAMM|nr:hypothetical protein [Marinobacter iranensis]MDF0749718.1 hypothetical protein [Marinobacter iranensis]
MELKDGLYVIATYRHSLVFEIRMTATNRQIISVLLSLLLVISGPALAISKMADAAVADCGSMMMDQAESTSSSSDTGSHCVSAPDMACPSASGLSQCGISFALLLADHTGFTDTGSQPVLSARAAIYQDPFLASVTPPPEHHS